MSKLSEVLSDYKLSEARANFEEQKQLLEKKKEGLVELELELASLRSRISELSVNPSEMEAHISRQLEKERIMLAEETRKANMLKEVNIGQNGLQIRGIESTRSKLDNLIKCVLQTGSNKELPSFPLVNNYDKQDATIDTVLESQIEQVKKLLLLTEKDSDSVEVTQSLIDKICAKINEEKLCPQVLDSFRYILLDEASEKMSDGEKKLIIYENEGNYLILKRGVKETNDVFEAVTLLINSLMSSELLDVICRAKFGEMNVTSFGDDLDLNVMFKALKQIRADLERKVGEDETKGFLKSIKKIKIREGGGSVSTKIVRRQIERLTELFAQLDDSPKWDAVRSSVILLKSIYLKRLELIVEEVCERRRAIVEMGIKSEAHTGNAIQIVLEQKQKEIDTLDEEIKRKKNELSEKTKELDKKVEQMKLAKENWSKQDVQLANEIQALKVELMNHEAALAKIQGMENKNKTELNLTKRQIEDIRNKLNELNMNKESLEAKEKEVNEALKSMVKERDGMREEKAKLENTKKHKESELTQIKTDTRALARWIQFLENVYQEFLNNRELFVAHRQEFAFTFFNETKSLEQKYKLLVANSHLEKYKSTELELVSKRSEAIWREQFDKFFKTILGPPTFLKTKPDAVEISSLNLNYDECEQAVRKHVESELDKIGLAIDTNTSILCSLKDDTYLKSYMNDDYDVIDGLKELLDCHLKATFLFKNKKTLKDTQRLWPDIELVGEKVSKLGDFLMKEVLAELKIGFDQVRPCFAKTMKLLAGNNVYMDTLEKLELRGINLGVFAGQDIIFAKGLNIDTSGQSGLKFRHDQAHSYGPDEAAQSRPGQDGEDGLDGFCGQNAGSVCIKANRHVVNLEHLGSIICKGGDGSMGQKGGEGQKGGKGIDTGDAKAQDIGMCLLNARFSAAFARIPGYNPDTNEFDLNQEKSGRGGNAGRAGFGGQHGFAAQVLIIDHTDFIRNTRGDKERFEFSDGLAALKERLEREKKIECVNGATSQNASTDVEGGKAGEPGYYGLDHVMMASEFFASQDYNGIKGDFSNLLKMNPETKEGKLCFEKYRDKYREDSIINAPDLYAKRSKSFTAISVGATTAAVSVLGILAAPMVMAAVAVIPTIGAAAWASGFALSASTWAGGTAVVGLLSSVGFSGYFSIKTLTGLNAEIRLGDRIKEKMRNQIEVYFKNRYCDDLPLRNESEARQNPRRDNRSRGENGEKSRTKSENERDEHGKSRETMINELETEAASLEAKCAQLRNDRTKSEALDALRAEAGKLKQEANSVEAVLNQVDSRVNELSNELAELSARVDEKELEQNELDKQIDAINVLIENQHASLSEQQQALLSKIDSYIHKMEQQIKANYEVEIRKIKESGKNRVQQKLKEFYTNLKSELEKERNTLADKKLSIQSKIVEKQQQRETKIQELATLRNQELESIMNKVRGEQKLAELNELQKRMKDEIAEKNEMEQTEEIMVMNEFKINNDDERKKLENDLNVDELVAELCNQLIEIRSIDEKIYKSLNVKISLVDIIQAALNYSNKAAIDPNLILGKVDFIIKTLSIRKVSQRINEFGKKAAESIEKAKIFEIKHILENLKNEPSKYLDFYFQYLSKTFFENPDNWNDILMNQMNQNFQLDCLNFIQKCGLNLRYQQIQNNNTKKKNNNTSINKQEKSSDQLLNYLEKEMLKFYMKISLNPKCGSLNANETMLMLHSYLNEINKIAQLDYPAVCVLNYNMNRFYAFVINSVGQYMETIDAYADIAKFIELVLVIKTHLESINKMQLWKTCDIMRSQLDLFGRLICIQEFDCIIECKRKIDKLLIDPNTSVFKLPIIKSTLYPKINMALCKRGLTVNDLNQQIDFLAEFKIESSEIKEDFILEFNRKFTSRAQQAHKYYSLSRDGFISKYGLGKKLDFAAIVDVVLDMNQAKAINMFNDLVSILNDDQTLDLEELLSLYKKIRPAKFPSLVVSRLEYLLSERIESLLVFSSTQYVPKTQNNEDLLDVFKDFLLDRTKHINSTSFKFLAEVKWAFYNKFKSLVFKDNEQVDENALKNILKVLEHARGQLDCKDCPPPLDANDEAIIKKVLCQKGPVDAAKKTGAQIFEDVVFELSNLLLQFDNIRIQTTSTTSDTDQQIKRLIEIHEKDLNERFEVVRKAISQNPVIVSIKAFVQVFDARNMENKCTEAIKKKLTEKSSPKKDLIVWIDEILNDEVITKMKPEKKYQIVKSAFQGDNKFIIEFLQVYDEAGVKSREVDYYRLVELIDLDGLLANQEYTTLFDYLEKLEAIKELEKKKNGDNFKAKLHKEYVAFSYRISQEYRSLSESSGDKKISETANLVKLAVQQQTEMSANNFDFLQKLRSFLDDYNKEINPNLTSEEMSVKKNLLLKIKELLKTRIAIEQASSSSLPFINYVPNVTREKILKKEWNNLQKNWQHYLFYMGVLLACEEVDIESLEGNIIELKLAFADFPFSDTSNEIFQLVLQAEAILEARFFASFFEYVEVFFQNLQDLKDQCEADKKSIMTSFFNQIENKNELAKKGRTNFMLELLVKHHNMAHSLCIFKLKSSLNTLKTNIETNNWTAKNIENYCIGLVNQTGLEAEIPHAIEKFNQDLDKEFKGIHSLDAKQAWVFRTLYGDSKQKGEKCVLGDLVKFLNGPKSAENSKSVLAYLDFIESVMSVIYFLDQDEQYIIDEFRQELIECLQKLDDKDLRTRVKALDTLLIDSCFKTNYYLSYIDRIHIDFNIDDFKPHLNELIDLIKPLFKKIDLALSPEFKKSKLTAAMHLQLTNLVNGLMKENTSREFVQARFGELMKTLKDWNSGLNEFMSDAKKTNVAQRFFIEVQETLNNDQLRAAQEKLSSLETTIKHKDQISYDLLRRSAETLLGYIKQEIELQLTNQVLESDQKMDEKLRLMKIFNFLDSNLNWFEPSQILAVYTIYKDCLPNISEDLLDQRGFDVYKFLYNEQLNIKLLLTRLCEFESTIAAKKLSVAVALLSAGKFHLNDIKKSLKAVSGRLDKDESYLNVFQILVTVMLACTKYRDEIEGLMYRLKSLIENPENLEYAKAFYKILEQITAESKHTEIVKSMFKEIGYEWFVEQMLTKTEKTYCEILDQNKSKQMLTEQKIHICGEVLENEFIVSMSKKMLCLEKGGLQKSSSWGSDETKLLEDLISSTYFDQAESAYSKLAKLLVNEDERKSLHSILLFKFYMFQSKELIADRTKWAYLIKILQEKKASKSCKLSIDDISNILFFSRMFDDVHQIVELINSVSGENLSKMFLILTLGIVLMKLGQTSKQVHKSPETEITNLCKSLVDKIDKSTTANSSEYLKLVISKLADDYTNGLRYQSSEMYVLKSILELTLSLRLYDPENQKFFKKLANIKILKWDSVLNMRKIKETLGRNDHEDDELVHDLLQIEKNIGAKITWRFINLIKNRNVEELQLKYMVKKFKRNVWELNDVVIDTVLETKEPTEWVRALKDRERAEKGRELKVNDLVSLMKQHETSGGINWYVRDLLERNKDDGCILERCLRKLDCMKKESEISKFTPDQIGSWTKNFKMKNEGRKSHISSIDDPAVLELVLVISRAAQCVFTYSLRSTQLMALLIFIDSILNKMKGRLANISTGEGKSLITISTTIAQLLLKGGNVDILTSSEILAERDAEESEQMFALFDIHVSNNCDAKANGDENLRKERYAKNQVIYGEIGNFQRDILLTKYYNKGIREQLARCLIVDEVDSMCIDNMCNTLYISHQIADLRELKDIYVFIWQAVHMRDTTEHTAHNVSQVFSYIEKLTREGHIKYPSNLKEFVKRRLKTWINNAYMAKLRVQEGNHYSVLENGKRAGQCVINDLQTGVEQMNTQWSDGLQQFVQLKHTNKLNEESLKAIFMSNYIYFMNYGGNIYGMTGTLGATLERELLNNAYGLDFFQLPRFKKELNVRMEPILVATRTQWLAQLKEEVNAMLAPNRVIDQLEIDDLVAKKSKTQSKLKEVDEKIVKQIEKIKEDAARMKKLLDSGAKPVEDASLKKELASLQSEKEGLECEIEDIHDIQPATKESEKETSNDRNPGGRAILVICENKKDVSDIVKALLVKHKHLYDYNGKVDGLRRIELGFRKVPIKSIVQVRPGDVIVATNVAGRGYDFKVSRLLEANGGLHVIMSYIPSNIRVELQGFGRSGRKGENGSGRMIVYDHRARNPVVDLLYLIDERDQAEEDRLQEIRVKMIPRVEIEMQLFKKFEKLQDQCKKYVQDVLKKETKYWDHQMKSLHNKWAFWLDSMSIEINNVYKSDRTEIFASFSRFEAKILLELKRNEANGFEHLIDEPNELIKLAKYNIESGNYKAAIINCNKVLTSFGLNDFGFGYYYKAMATLRPLSAADYGECINSFREKWIGHEITYQEKLETVDLIKKAISSFEREIERIQMRSIVLSNVGKKNQGIGSNVDFFSKSNANEISALMIHLNASKAIISQEINIEKMSKSLKNSVFSDTEAIDTFKRILNAIDTDVKKQRFSSKLRLKIHIKYSSKNQALLEAIQNMPHTFLEEEQLLIVDDCTEDALKSFDANIETELYIWERLDGEWKVFEYPKPFSYTKKRFISEIRKISEKQQRGAREEAFSEFLKSCLSIEKIWNFVKKLGLVEVKAFALHDDHKKAVENDKIWENREKFGNNGNDLKSKLLSTFEKNKFLIQTYFEDMLPANLRPKSTDLIEFLKSEKFFKDVGMFEYSPSTKELINDFINKVIITKPDPLVKLDFTGFELLSLHEQEIRNALDQKGQKSEPFTKIDMVNILNRSLKISLNHEAENIADSGDDDELSREFFLFRKYLAISGVSRSLSETLNIDVSEFDTNELIEIEGFVELLYKMVYFNNESIDLTPTSQLTDEFIKHGVVKAPTLGIKLSHDIADIGRLESRIKALVKEEVKRVINLRIDEEKFVTETELKENKQDNKQAFVESKKELELDRLNNLIVNSFMDIFGSIKRHQKSMITVGHIESYFLGTTMPREVLEYTQLGKDLVLTIGQYNKPWSWQTLVVALTGVVQIAAGAVLMAYPILGAFSYHLGSALISEGASDLIFAISNSGNITGRSYWNNKKLSLAITVVTVGVGAYLSGGAAIGVNIAKEQAARLGLKLWSKMVIKKIIGEVGKSILNHIKSLALDKIAEVLTKEFFKKFRDTIMWMIRKSYGYKQGIEQVKAHLEGLGKKVNTSDDLMSILQDNVSQSEQDMSTSLNNQITSLTSKCCGPLASQIGEVSSVTRFSGLKLNEAGTNIINKQAEKYAKIAKAIGVALKIISVSNTAYELVSVVNRLLQLIAKKLQIKTEILQSNVKSGVKVDQAQEAQCEEQEQEFQEIRETNNSFSRRRREEAPEKHVQIEEANTEATVERNSSGEIEASVADSVRAGVILVEQRLFENIERKVQTQIVSPQFNALVAHIMTPLSKQLEKAFFSEFEDFKTQTLGYAEYDRRLEKNKQEKRLEMELFKDHVTDALSKLQFESPIKQVDLSEVTEGILEVEIDGEKVTLDLSKEEDRNLIRDKIGSLQIRILPSGSSGSSALRLSRPNFANYLKSLTPDKQINESDLEMIAHREGRTFVILTENEPKVIGPENKDKAPFFFGFAPGVKENTGHFIPMVMEGDQLVAIDDLPTTGANACGLESLVYLKNRESLIEAGVAAGNVHSEAIKSVHAKNIGSELNDIINFASTSPSMRNQFLSRAHESKEAVIGGQRKYLHIDSQPFWIEYAEKKLNIVIEEHAKSRVESMFKLKSLVNKLKKATNGQFICIIEKKAFYQDYKGKKNNHEASIENNDFKTEEKFNKENPITDQPIGNFKNTHAAHRLAFNIKNLDEPTDSDEVKRLQLEIKQTLAKTDLLPGAVNNKQETFIDTIQAKLASEFLNEEKQNNATFYKKFVDGLYDSFKTKSKLRFLQPQMQVWNVYTKTFEQMQNENYQNICDISDGNTSRQLNPLSQLRL